eukprot:GHVL01031483.1.p1 GENE.GHVL01031483.1~~GHVL01031483.1.p1  ORF type:complete len:261 (+),score=21.22 GHVL01031483.1:592-1374(+)
MLDCYSKIFNPRPDSEWAYIIGSSLIMTLRKQDFQRPNFLLMSRNSLCRDFTFTASFFPPKFEEIDATRLSNTGNFGIVFRFVGLGSYLAFDFNPEDGRSSLIECNNGYCRALQRPLLTGLSEKKLIKIIAQGDSIQLIIDNNVQSSISNERLPTGLVGVYAPSVDHLSRFYSMKLTASGSETIFASSKMDTIPQFQQISSIESSHLCVQAHIYESAIEACRIGHPDTPNRCSENYCERCCDASTNQNQDAEDCNKKCTG